MKLKHLLYGIATFVPGLMHLRAKGTGGTDSARYCYSVWLRYLVMAEQNRLNTNPKTVAELGPGDSIGIGLAALISGCDKYLAFDVVEHANIKRNLSIFNELVTLFENKTPIPGDDEWPKVIPKLEDYRFPSDILDDDRLHKALHKSRIDRIRNSIIGVGTSGSMIEYKAPWHDDDILSPESVDIIYSQAVLEHVDDLTHTYNTMHSWLNPTGYIAHTIDFKSHGFANKWNGHWTYSDFLWKLLRGKRPYLLNREPYSTHEQLINNAGFRLRSCTKTSSESHLTTKQLAPRFRSMSQDDLVTSAVFIQAVKRPQNDV